MISRKIPPRISHQSFSSIAAPDEEAQEDTSVIFLADQKRSWDQSKKAADAWKCKWFLQAVPQKVVSSLSERDSKDTVRQMTKKETTFTL